MSAPADSITVLHAHGERRLAKTFTVATIGTVTKTDYDNAVWFTAEERPVAGIRDLHRALLDLEGDPHAGVIRGALAEGVDPSKVRRKKTGKDAPFVETPRHWLQADVDGVPLPAGTSILDDPHDAASAILAILEAHAPELEGVTTVVQFSSSAALNELAEAEEAAGMPARWRGVAKPGVSAHVWIWLTEAAGEPELKRWVERVNSAAGFKLLDAALTRTVQPHFTASPVFKGGLRDPLAGRRTLLIEGAEDAATLLIPAPKARTYTPSAADGTADTGGGYEAQLAAIGGANGFRNPMLSAISAFIARNWPAPDIDALKGDIRRRIEVADPAGRSDAVLDDYASDAHLDQIIAWVREREGEKRAAQAEERRQPDVAPTFPDRAVTLAEAARLADAVFARFAGEMADGANPALMARITVGAGKTEAAIRNLPMLLDAARKAGREGAIYILIPRHDLGDEVRARVEQANPGMKVTTWRGMDRADPNNPNVAMCLDLELPKAAAIAGLPHTEPCSACPLKNECGYRGQARKDAEVVVLAHNAGFHKLPGGMPEAAMTIWDEAWWQAGLGGAEADEPIELPLGDLLDERTGRVTGNDRLLLLHRRRAAHDALAGHERGGLLREVLIDAGWTPEMAREWHNLEWETKPRVKLKGATDRGEILERLREAGSAGFNRKRAILAKNVRDLLDADAARSINAQVVRGGTAVRLTWRSDFAEWVADAPKLFLDATTAPEIVKAWVPELVVEDIEVAAPHQHVRQIVGAEFGRAWFTRNANNVSRVADLISLEMADSRGDVLVIAQEAVEHLLRSELLRRFDEVMPARLHLAHHGAVTGMDLWGKAERVIEVGRPAINRRQGEWLAEIIGGAPVETVPDDEESRWPTVAGGIRMADGTARGVRQPRHPDPLVEAVRWSISEGAVVQAIGRGRGVQRTEKNPVVVTVLAEFALPLTVETVETWDDVQPDRLTVAAAEAVVNGTALPFAPMDLALARSDLFPSVRAAALFFERSDNTPQTLIGLIYKRWRGVIPCRYRSVGARGPASHALVPVTAPREELERIVGPLSFFEMEMPKKAPPTPAEPAPPPVPSETEMIIKITEPPISGVWSVQGADWRVTIAADAGTTVSLWAPSDCAVPERTMVPMLLPLAPLPTAPPGGALDPDPFAGWKPTPACNTLTRMMTT